MIFTSKPKFDSILLSVCFCIHFKLIPGFVSIISIAVIDTITVEYEYNLYKVSLHMIFWFCMYVYFNSNVLLHDFMLYMMPHSCKHIIKCLYWARANNSYDRSLESYVFEQSTQRGYLQTFKKSLTSLPNYLLHRIDVFWSILSHNSFFVRKKTATFHLPWSVKLANPLNRF